MYVCHPGKPARSGGCMSATRWQTYMPPPTLRNSLNKGSTKRTCMCEEDPRTLVTDVDTQKPSWLAVVSIGIHNGQVYCGVNGRWEFATDDPQYHSPLSPITYIPFPRNAFVTRGRNEYELGKIHSKALYHSSTLPNHIFASMFCCRCAASRKQILLTIIRLDLLSGPGKRKMRTPPHFKSAFCPNSASGFLNSLTVSCIKRILLI